VKNEGKYQISRNKIRLWLQKQDTYTLHKPVRYRFRRNRVIVGAMDDEWEADLVIMDSLSQQNNGYKYVLTVIDVLRKYAWVEAIKAKTGNNLVKAFEKIIKKGRKPNLVRFNSKSVLCRRKFTQDELLYKRLYKIDKRLVISIVLHQVWRVCTVKPRFTIYWMEYMRMRSHKKLKDFVWNPVMVVKLVILVKDNMTAS
jgi:hypothetical protein